MWRAEQPAVDLNGRSFLGAVACLAFVFELILVFSLIPAF